MHDAHSLQFDMWFTCQQHAFKKLISKRQFDSPASATHTHTVSSLLVSATIEHEAHILKWFAKGQNTVSTTCDPHETHVTGRRLPPVTFATSCVRLNDGVTWNRMSRNKKVRDCAKRDTLWSGTSLCRLIANTVGHRCQEGNGAVSGSENASGILEQW